MSRRKIGLLALVLVLAAVGFGGSGFDLLFGGTADEARSTSSSTTSSGMQTYSDARFQGALEEANVSANEWNASLTASKRRSIASGSLTYVTEARSITEMRDESKQVAATYARAVENGYARATLYVSVLDGDGNKVGSYAIRRAWAVAYNRGKLSARAYTQRVLQTGTFITPVTPITATAAGSTTVATAATATSNTDPIVTPTPTRAPSAGYTDTEFQDALEEVGIELDYLQPDQQAQDAANARGPLVIEYTTTTTNASTRREEVGIVADQYARAVATGYQRTNVSATTYRPDGQLVAEFRIERAWALAYAQGDLSAEQYGQLIGRTYRSFTTHDSSLSATPTQRTAAATTVSLEPNETDTTTTEPDTETVATTETELTSTARNDEPKKMI